jgi:hypothetical protein
MRVHKGGAAQLFRSTTTSAESEENSVRWQVADEGRFHEYLIDLSANASWKSVIETLRLDPTDIPRRNRS